MNLLKAYLSTPRAQKALTMKPGEHGFSLIELVVVVAVLAILSAIAIPNFLSINDDARVSGVKNTMATLVKECAVKLAQGGTADYTLPQLGSSNYAFTTSGTDGTCASDDKFTATADPTTLPTFMVTLGGVKTCTAGATATAANREKGCNDIDSTSKVGSW